MKYYEYYIREHRRIIREDGIVEGKLEDKCEK